MSPVKRRTYNSARRRQQAAATRDEIATAARRLFARGGYAATTIEAIAQEAGVALQTVYAAFGSKRQILLTLFESMQGDAGQRRLHELRDAAHAHPAERLRVAAQFHRGLFDHGGDIIETIRSAGHADPDIGVIWKEADRRRREGTTRLARSLARSRDLRPGLREQDAAAILYAFMNEGVYRDLVTESGWSPEEYETWLSATLQQLLLGRTRHAR